MNKSVVALGALGALAVVVVACTGGSGDLSGGINEPVGKSGGSQTRKPAEEDDSPPPSSNGNGSQPDAATSLPPVACGDRQCTGTQMCLVPCCVGTEEEPCKAAPPFCMTQTTEPGCTGTASGDGRTFTCVCE